ncbi:hypothetical protein EUGRSUZ_A00246 [Eucalyptus grandis]|uniref:Uncharacterized protein n=2 Tax=Eucalyptus grandis TaxID=71139 RepID=A0ACC3LYF0_EUCGR|nr:hypothetical protein EUGRSUZ_A00246 [Eucalyptus grandis]
MAAPFINPSFSSSSSSSFSSAIATATATAPKLHPSSSSSRQTPSVPPPSFSLASPPLAKLSVDIIEAGFPTASSYDFVAVKAIALEVGNAIDPHSYIPVICGLSRCNEKDILTAWDAVRFARRPRIHTFIATSGIHMQYKLKKSKQEVIDIARRMVAFAWSLGCDDVEFSPEDAGRSEREFLYEILGEVIKAGATTLNIPDTVGITMPEEFGKLIADIKVNTPGIENVIISTHCHNDLGLSTANTIAGACAGARQVEVTINGIGERAGNASLEEVVMALKCKGGSILGGLYTGINTRHIIMTSKMVEGYSDLYVQPHKAIVGANAFAHESGIHQDGMLKHTGTYEIISPDDIGHERTNEVGIVLGKLRHFIIVAEHMFSITNADIRALVSDEVSCGTLGLSTATVKLISADGKELIACAVGTGPVDSAYKAVDLIVKVPAMLLEYSMAAFTEDIDAIATTQVLIRDKNNHMSTLALTGETIHQTFSGTGSSMDIAVSSVRAYIGALNKMFVSWS